MMIGAVILQAVLISLNAVFACAEIAVISLNDTKLKHLTQEGDRRAKKLSGLVEQPAKFLATIQVAITMAGLLGGAFAADNFAGPVVELMLRAGVRVPETVLRSAVVVLITVILTFFSLIFGELVPKRIAMKRSEELALGMSGMLLFVSRAFAPLVWLLTVSTNGILRLLGIDPNEEEAAVTEEEIRMMLAEGNEQGRIQTEERRMIQNVFEFDDTSVEQVSTRRKDVVALDLEDGIEEWDRVIRNSRFTCYPVYEGDYNQVVGVLDAKDYLRSERRDKDYVMKHMVDKPFFVVETTRANVLLGRMKQERIYFAVILDEYGDFSGIVTMHDLMEALVGEIGEEKEPPKPADVEQIDSGTWIVRGGAGLGAVSEALGVELRDAPFDTFNGFIWGAIDRVPSDGERFALEAHGLKIEVREVRQHMIQYAVVTRERQGE